MLLCSTDRYGWHICMSILKVETCVPNINSAERRKRLVSGVVMLAAGLGTLAALLFYGVNPWWRLALFPVFAGAAAGYFQWRDET
jgi:fatty acid desaturase